MARERRAACWILALAGVVAAIALARPAVSRGYSNLAMVAVYRHAHAVAAGAASGGDLARADALVMRALALDADNRAARRGRGFLLWEQGAREEAGAEWRRGGIPVGDFVRAAWQAQNAGSPSLAMEWYRRAMAAWPDVGDPYVGAAGLYERDKDWETALALYERALAVDSFYSSWMERRAHQGRGDILRQLGRLEEALAEYEWIVAHAPDYYWGYTHLAELAWEVQGDAQRAERLYQQAIALDASIKWAYRGLATLYEQTGRLQDAEAAYRKVLELDPNDEVARSGLERLTGGP